MQREKVIELLRKYLPDGYEDMICNWLFEHPIHFKIVNPRSTKLGDFRPGLNGKKSQITVNGNLNKYSFLITTVHEFAHYFVFRNHGLKIQPHGSEWKNEYRSLILQLINKKKLPKDIEIALMNSLINTKASSCSDIQLNRALKNYNLTKNKAILLEEIAFGTSFWLSGKLMIKGQLRRKRYLCDEINTNKKYLVHQLAEIKPHEKK
ncbi:MAG: hypothetical protein HYU67_02905 [Flavobacteriia bacterium]|nr:hypothetical protein [Flavobacteriia bacterium]